MNLSSPATPSPAQAARAQTCAYYLAFTAPGLTTALLGPTLPGLAVQTGARLGEISTLFTARSLGYMLGSLAGGRLYDRMRGHPLIAGALAMMAALMAAIPLVPRLWLLGFVLLVLGMGEGSLDVGCNTLLVWVHGHRVAPFMNGLHFFFGLGTFIAPIVVAQVALHTEAYRLLAIAVLPAALWLVRLPSPSRPIKATGQATGRQSVVLTALVGAFLLCYVGAEVSFGGWVYSYATAMGLGGPAAAAYLTSAFWGAFTLGRLAGIPITARLSPRTVLLADLAGCLASAGVLLAFPRSTAALWLGSIGLGLAMASIFPVTISLAERYLAITGQATGWFMAASGVGSMTLPWLIGQLFEPLGPRTAIAVVPAAFLAALGIFAALDLCARRMKGTP